jgi:hypothetical protein
LPVVLLSYHMRRASGSAILPNGVFQTANLKIGVAGLQTFKRASCFDFV